MGYSRTLSGLFLLSIAVCLGDEISKCTRRTSECPEFSLWPNRSIQMNCTKLYYVCLMDKNSNLVEGCFPNYEIKEGKVGCPYVDRCHPTLNLPVLAENEYHHCPPSTDGCPESNHTRYRLKHIHKYVNCVTGNESHQNSSRMTFKPITTTTLDQEHTYLKNSTIEANIFIKSERHTEVASIVIICLLVVIIVIFVVIYFRHKLRERRAPSEDNRKKVTYMPIYKERITQDTTKRKSQETVISANSSKDSLRVPEENLSLSSDILSELEVNKQSCWVIRNSNSDVRCPNEGFENENNGGNIQYQIVCSRPNCHESVRKLCLDCKKNSYFCEVCSRKHISEAMDHDVISFNNKNFKCWKHPEKQITFHCIQCQEYGCNVCGETHESENGHHRHPLKKLSERIVELRSKVKEKIELVKFKLSSKILEWDVQSKKKKTLANNTTISELDRRDLIKETDEQISKLESELTELRDLGNKYMHAFRHENITEMEEILQ